MEMDLEKRLNEESGQEEMIVESPKNRNKQRGGVRTMPFILANEICDKFAGVGFYANMITYLTKQLNLPLVQASNTLNNFVGTANFTPLIGALIADSFTGQFWTITIGSIFYQLGMLILTISAVIPKLHPQPCLTQVNCQPPTSWQLWIFYTSLLLTCIGAGGIRPCVVTFAANQFDMSKSAVAARKWNYFNWYYFFMGLGTLSALTIIVYIQDYVGWGLGLGIPTIAMTISVIAFVIGYPLYIIHKPKGSPLIRIVQVGVAAWKKRKVDLPSDPCLLYQNWELDAPISTNGKLLHTHQFKWLNKAAIITEEDKVQKSPNLWNLSTVHRVEELKSIIKIMPIWAAGILLVTASSHQGSFMVQQAQTMNRHLSSSFKIPPASLSIFNLITMLTGLVLYEHVFVPIARKLTRNPAGITCLQRMGVGFVINLLATIIASLVEIRRKTIVARYHLFDNPTASVPMSVFWLIPQYCLHGLGEVFISVGQIEFLYDQAPESMRSTAAGLFCLSTAIGNYLGTLVVTLVHTFTVKGHDNWFPDRNINKGRLEYYYGLISVIQLFNFIYYVICAYCYTYKPLEQVKENDTQKEETTHVLHH